MTEELYTPHPRESYGIRHVPLIVRPVPSRHIPGQCVAFIGKQRCFFERDGLQPQPGVPIEVMITRPLNGKKLYQSPPGSSYPSSPEDPHYVIDRSRLTAVLIQPVETDKHILVAIDGFECSGTMCTTTAQGVITTGQAAWSPTQVWPLQRKDKVIRSRTEPVNDPKRMSLTPGRSGVIVAHNVNAGSTWKQPYQKLTPTNVYVERDIYEEKQGYCVRVAGLTRPEDCDYFHLFRK